MPSTPLNIPNVDDLVTVLGKVVASNVGHYFAARQVTMKTVLSVRVLVWLFDWILRRQLGGVCLVFKLKTTLRTSMVQSRFCKSTTLQIVQVAWTIVFFLSNIFTLFSTPPQP